MYLMVGLTTALDVCKRQRNALRWAEPLYWFDSGQNKSINKYNGDYHDQQILAGLARTLHIQLLLPPTKPTSK